MAASPTTTETREPATASPLDSHPSPIAGPRHSKQATASLVLALLALPLLLLGFLGIGVAVLAIILGAVARADARRKGDSKPTRAMAGIILGAVDIGVFVVVIAVVAATT
jgi:Domain of unknown function (DUF4190)